MLHELGMRSLMVEGGAQVIASFFAATSVVDTVIITVAPTFVGADGVGYDVLLGVVFFYIFLFIPLENNGVDLLSLQASTMSRQKCRGEMPSSHSPRLINDHCAGHSMICM